MDSQEADLPRQGIPVRVGVIGTGRLGREHARIYREIPEAKLVGVADLDEQRGREVAQALGVPFHGNADELLDRVQAVSVAVPTAAHKEVVERALAKGVDVLVEKPIASTLAEADRLIEVAREQGRRLGVGHVERYGPAAQALLETVREPRFIECHRLAPFDPRGTDVAVVLDLMIHDLDMLLALSPGELVRADAVGVPVLTNTVDIANARLEFSRGLIANLTASRVSRDRLRKMRVFQPDAYLSLDYQKQRLEVYRRRGSPTALAASDPRSLDLAQLIEHQVVAPSGPEPLRRELAAFLEALSEGRPAPVSGEDGRRALALAQLIMERMGERSTAAWTPEA